MDRLLEPGDFSKAARSNAETPGYQLQAVHGHGGPMAKSSKHGSTRSQLSAFGGGCSNRQGGFRCGRAGWGNEAEGMVGQNTVGRLIARIVGGSSFCERVCWRASWPPGNAH